MNDEYASVAQYYDFVAPYSSRGDVEFYVDLAREAAGPLLEIGCGTGRILIPSARAGATIVGYDGSQAMLDVCQRKLADEPDDVRTKVTLVQGDMRAIDLGRRFALITIPFRPFQHLITVDDQLACLDGVRRHLAPGGRAVIDLFNPSLQSLTTPGSDDEIPEEGEAIMPDGAALTRAHRVLKRDVFNQVNDIELIYYVRRAGADVSRFVHAFQMRYLFRFEAEHLMVRAGFKVEALYADFDRSPFGSKYPGELIFVLRAE